MKLTKIYTCWSTICGEPWLRISEYKNEGEGCYGHQEHEVAIEVAEPGREEVVSDAVNQLRAEQAKHRAEIKRLDDRIASLLCLENKEEA